MQASVWISVISPAKWVAFPKDQYLRAGSHWLHTGLLSLHISLDYLPRASSTVTVALGPGSSVEERKGRPGKHIKKQLL